MRTQATPSVLCRPRPLAQWAVSLHQPASVVDSMARLHPIMYIRTSSPRLLLPQSHLTCFQQLCLLLSVACGCFVILVCCGHHNFRLHSNIFGYPTVSTSGVDGGGEEGGGRRRSYPSFCAKITRLPACIIAPPLMICRVGVGLKGVATYLDMLEKYIEKVWEFVKNSRLLPPCISH